MGFKLQIEERSSGVLLYSMVTIDNFVLYFPKAIRKDFENLRKECLRR
jgi:hypothetical protein